MSSALWFCYSLSRCSCLQSTRTTKTFDTRHTQSDEEHFLYDFNGWNLHNFIIQFCSIVRAHTAPCSECSRMTFNDCKTFSRVCWSSFALVSIVSEIEIQMRSLMSFKQNLGIVKKKFSLEHHSNVLCFKNQNHSWGLQVWTFELYLITSEECACYHYYCHLSVVLMAYTRESSLNVNWRKLPFHRLIHNTQLLWPYSVLYLKRSRDNDSGWRRLERIMQSIKVMYANNSSNRNIRRV